MTDRPFRWDISKREQLGRHVSGPTAEAYPAFVGDLRRCCARVLATAGDADLVFVGRSPESLFDYLSGCLQETRWALRIALLNLSIYGLSPDEIRKLHSGAIEAVRAYLEGAHLSPEQIATRPRTVAFVDLVASGGTFGHLAELLLGWAREINYDENAVIRRLRFTAITWATEPSPSARRWKKQCRWVRCFRPSAIRSVSIPGDLWDYLGNRQEKVARWHPPDCWGDAAATTPPRDESHLKALRLAVWLHELARTREERLALASELAEQPAMRFGWFRSLVTELRTPSAQRRPTRSRSYARTSLQARATSCRGGARS